ncbi:hypothetical protein FRX31_025187 [Thalictrum thalictroides]|uniref:Uncharacterized protein n=1 Tax=Thalictrum thalictroides TaxID=46969 RepID=A0A7J6VJD6_THATH|nr:hypothetical protein FRX31_025187 [Thalictrum thalictroides]
MLVMLLFFFSHCDDNAIFLHFCHTSDLCFCHKILEIAGSHALDSSHEFYQLDIKDTRDLLKPIMAIVKGVEVGFWVHGPIRSLQCSCF